MSPSALSAAKSAYATAAQGAGRALVAAHVMSPEPPSRDHRTRHWLHSLARVHDSPSMIGLDVPWWTYRAIDVVDTWLQARATPALVFEYGSGASTAWLAKRSELVHSVEHHAGFAASMADSLAAYPNVVQHVQAPVESTQPVVPSRKEGHDDLDFAAYVATIDEVDGEFDLVVVDGRAREACLERSVPRLAAGGLVVFDNSRRGRYRAAIGSSGLHEQALPGLTPTLPYPDQTSLLYRPRP